jgi:ATP-dependent DNA helicase RecG
LFRGRDRSQIDDSQAIHDFPDRAVEVAIEFVHKTMRRAAEIGAVRRRDRWTLPPVAIREAIINAVVHTDYSQQGAPIRLALFDNRLEVENPGLLPFGLTLDDIRAGVSRLRNRAIGRVFHELGLIEQWGSGIQRMTAACREAGLPDPLLEEIGTRFRVTLFTSPASPPTTDAIDQMILAALADANGLSTQEIASLTMRSTRATRNRLIKLIERGLIQELGANTQDPMRRYFLAVPA